MSDETPEQRRAREQAEDEAATREFMGSSYKEPPKTEEDAREARNKAAYEAREHESALKQAAKLAQQREAMRYLEKADAKRMEKVSADQWTPQFIKEWALKRMQSSASAETPEQAYARATRYREDELAADARRVKNANRDAELPEVVKYAIAKASPPREMRSFTRGSGSPEEIEEAEAFAERARRAANEAKKQ